MKWEFWGFGQRQFQICVNLKNPWVVSDRRAAIIQASLPFSFCLSQCDIWVDVSCCAAVAMWVWALRCLISWGIKTDYRPLFSGVWTGLDRAVISCNALCPWFAADDLIRLAADRSPHLWLPISQICPLFWANQSWWEGEKKRESEGDVHLWNSSFVQLYL